MFTPSSLTRAVSRPAALALGLAMALSACADRNHVEVGAIPDDYRTRHPIVVSEAEVGLDIPVVSTEGRLSSADRERVRDFAGRFKTARATTIRVLQPSGSGNALAADLVTRDVVAALKANGVGSNRILVQPYPAADLGGPAPIHLAYVTLAAKTDPCGRWPEDLANTSDNRNYFNFGCASQQNLAAQIADPRDLLSPRGLGEIDAERRTQVIGDYRTGNPTGAVTPSSNVDYDW
ncbi:CpaD family pilus assembly protein [Consotaella salsifontis]|uniref:Pilus assembly protein CpaD n=1 Tax=Consotaella salsifontis TaxID=1365950 RepID=A0A1T4S0X1_9HYPH|nr:CpaD family pilus assembly lipoprotein [Consotaella salsifontis]SKA21807.1 pilus assembly protein CpaD [Consotaella salsifontis]